MNPLEKERVTPTQLLRHGVGMLRKCKRCQNRFEDHKLDALNTVRCEDGQVFKASVKRVAASQSFTPEEVRIGKRVLAGVLQGSLDVQLLAREPAFGKLLRKFNVMQATVEDLKKAEKT